MTTCDQANGDCHGDNPDQCSFIMGVVIVVKHKLRAQQISAITIIPELGKVDLHGLIGSLIIKSRHLTSRIPHGHWIIVGWVDPLTLRINTAELSSMILEEKSILLLADQLFSLCFGERRHLVKCRRLGPGTVHVESDRTAVNDHIGHLFGDAKTFLHLLMFLGSNAGRLCCLLYGSVPFEGYFTRSGCDIKRSTHWRVLDAHEISSAAIITAINQFNHGSNDIDASFLQRPQRFRSLKKELQYVIFSSECV